MKSVWLAFCVIAAGMGVSALLASRVGPLVNPAVPPAGLDAHETHAAASLLGQFRTNASSWLWLRTDLYLHNGVEMRPLTEAEVKAGKRGVGGRQDGHEAIMNDDRIVSVIPSAAADFRGVFGDVERAVSSYMDMSGHSHNDPVQTLPLIRLMTWLDPQFVLAWITGATIMARDRSEKGTVRALEFLAEAETHNPRSVAVPTEKARLLISRRKDLLGAEPLLSLAMRRGQGSKAPLADIEKEALNLAARLLALVYRDENKPELLKEHLEVAQKIFPDDPMLKRLAEDLNSKPAKG